MGEEGESRIVWNDGTLAGVSLLQLVDHRRSISPIMAFGNLHNGDHSLGRLLQFRSLAQIAARHMPGVWEAAIAQHRTHLQRVGRTWTAEQPVMISHFLSLSLSLSPSPSGCLLRGALDRRRKPFAVEHGDVRPVEAHVHAETPGFCGHFSRVVVSARVSSCRRRSMAKSRSSRHLLGSPSRSVPICRIICCRNSGMSRQSLPAIAFSLSATSCDLAIIWKAHFASM